MRIVINFDGVKIALEADKTNSVKIVIDKALIDIFPPESLPSIDRCVVALRGKIINPEILLKELDLENEYLQVTLIF